MTPNTRDNFLKEYMSSEFGALHKRLEKQDQEAREWKNTMFTLDVANKAEIAALKSEWVLLKQKWSNLEFVFKLFIGLGSGFAALVMWSLDFAAKIQKLIN